MKPERLRVPKDPPKEWSTCLARIDGKWRYMRVEPTDIKTTMHVLEDGSIEFVTEAENGKCEGVLAGSSPACHTSTHIHR